MATTAAPAATKPKIAILTMMIGNDYIKAMEPGMASKRAYASRHGYELLVGGTEAWDRTRPIPWSKLRWIFKHVDDYDYIFWMDADTIIMNPSLTLESHVIPALAAECDMLWTQDACGNLNNGNVLFRGRSEWLKDFLTRCYEQVALIHHIWWDNAAMIKLIQQNPSDAAKVTTLKEHWTFNSYVFGPPDAKADDADIRLYKPGDFLIHFAGVSDMWNIYRMMRYAEACAFAMKPMDPDVLRAWRTHPPRNRADAESALKIAIDAFTKI